MTASPRDQLAARNRFRRALLALEAAQISALTYQRRQKALPQEQRHTVQDAAAEVAAASLAVSAAGLVIDATDQRLLAQVRKYLADGAA
jgi:hypothetical protein